MSFPIASDFSDDVDERHARCGARTRTGAPCKRKPVPGRRRCPNHGGLSTGPKTKEGWARTREGHARWLAERARSASDDAPSA